VKNSQIADHSKTTEVKEINTCDVRILKILDIFGVCFTKFKNSQILLKNMLFSGQNIPTG
jgi:hypothetical protein